MAQSPIISKFGARGESHVKDGGEEIPLLFTNRALLEVERMVGKPIITILLDYYEKKISMDSISKILRVGLETARKESMGKQATVSLDEAFDILDRVGFTDCAAAIVSGISEVINYSQSEPEKEGSSPL